MARRYSGRAVVTVVYEDRGDAYKASVSVGGKVKWRGRVGAPRSGGGSRDGVVAYDNAARAALSFAMDDRKIDDDQVAFGEHGVHVGRSAASKHPKQENPRSTPKDAASLYRIRREPLNAGGYTAGKYGQYFGRGEPLFAVETPDGDVLHVRGADRQDAMRNFREQYKYHHGGVHRTARFFGEKRKVANPSRKRKPTAKRAPSRRKAR